MKEKTPCYHSVEQERQQHKKYYKHLKPDRLFKLRCHPLQSNEVYLQELYGTYAFGHGTSKESALCVGTCFVVDRTPHGYYGARQIGPSMRSLQLALLVSSYLLSPVRPCTRFPSNGKGRERALMVCASKKGGRLTSYLHQGFKALLARLRAKSNRHMTRP